MKRNKTLVKIVTIFTAFAVVGASLSIHHNVKPTRVEAAQHIDNFASYTYSGNYYKNIDFSAAEGLNGKLRQDITDLIYPNGWYTYSGTGTGTLSQILQQADADPTNSSNMIYLYTRDSVTKNAASSWNREHCWPQSLSNNCWGESKAGTDILHIRPTYNSTNSSRSNDIYADVNKASPRTYEGMTFGYGSGTKFEPLDAVKGDVARIIMYIWVAYHDYYSNLPAITNVFESFDTLLRWHTQDKPDALEGNRNNVAQSSDQGNRNPFVDHPELGWKIFGNSASTSVKSACMAAYPGDGSSTPPEPQGETVTLNFSMADYATANNVSSATKVTTIAADDVVTLQAVGSDSNTGNIYIGTDYTEWRFYKSGSGTLKITVPDGVTLESAKGQIGTSNYGAPSEVTFTVSNNKVEYNPGSNFNVKSLQIVYTIEAGNDEPTGISLNKSELAINVGDESQLTATLTPAGSSAIVSWSSSNSSVATVANGAVRGVAAGTATITASTGSLSASCTVTVTAIPEPEVETKTLAEFIAGSNTKTKAYYVTGQIEEFKTGSTKDKYGNMKLTDGTNSLVIYGSTMTASALAWNNANAYVFTNPQNFMTNATSNALSIGDTITMKLIRCDYTNNGTTTIEGQGIITNIGVSATAVSLDQTSVEIKAGNSITLTATLTPSNATSAISWLSSDTSVVTVNNGVVTGVAAGTATITAKVSDSVKAECAVTVTEDSIPVVNDEKMISIVDSGLSAAYGTNEEKVFDGIKFDVTKVANYGNGVQFQNNSSAAIFNKDSFVGNIKWVNFNFNAKNATTTVNNQTSSKGALKILFADNANFNNAETIQVRISQASTAETVKITPTIAGPIYAKIMSNSCGAVYCSSIDFIVETARDYLSSVSNRLAVNGTEEEGQIVEGSISLRFGASIPVETWNTINAKWAISEYGVMMIKKSSLTASGYSSIEAAYGNRKLSVVSKSVADDGLPFSDGENYLFTAGVNSIPSSNYSTYICAAPYIVAGGEYIFLSELEYSVMTMAEYCLANGGSNLSDDALAYLAA